MLKIRDAFSLLELLIVVTLLGVIAAYGIPTFNNSREKVDEKEAVHNLRMINEAFEQHRVRNNGNFPNVNMPAVADINTVLELNIIEQNVDYSCSALNLCQAVTPHGWTVEYDSSAVFDDRVICGAGPCPSCPGAGCSYDGLF